MIYAICKVCTGDVVNHVKGFWEKLWLDFLHFGNSGMVFVRKLKTLVNELRKQVEKKLKWRP
jgi:hypothetical protein